MKILYYSAHPTHDIVSEVGYATHQREVILALRRAGHIVIPVVMGGTDEKSLNPLANISYKPPFIKRLLKGFIPKFIWTSLNNFKLILHDRKAGKILEETILAEKPDLVYERSEYLQDSGARVCSKRGVRYFLEVNAPFIEEMHDFEGYSIYHKKAHRAEAFKLKTAERIFCVSAILADFLANTYGCERSKIFIQPNCIDKNKPLPDHKDIEQLRASLGFENKRVIGFVGSMFPYHGVDTLIEAFAIIAGKYRDAILMIVGDGIVLPELQRQSLELGLDNRVVFTGRIPHKDIFNYIGIMDICVMARSNWYGSPVKIFEYGWMNKPILAPRNGPVCDVMEHNKDGFLCGESVKEVSSGLEVLLSDPSKASEMAECFHLKVCTEYTWDRAAENIMQYAYSTGK